jgi:PAS domain S-box-containing protein
LFEGEVRTVGEVPGTIALRDIGHWLDGRPRATVIATASLGKESAAFAGLIPIASGVLAVPVSNSPGEYLLWLRPERVRTVTWGGNPNEPHEVGDDPMTLSPRRSFAQWQQVVEGTADPWRECDLAAARLIGETVSDVVLQFRSVRMLIAEDQLEQVRRQVQQAEPPVVIADADGQILQINSAFAALLPPRTKRPSSLSDLRSLFTGPDEAKRELRELTKTRRAWRGEVWLEGADGAVTPLLVRADPVIARQNRPLGFVLVFTDMTERKAAEIARRRFQEAVIEERRPMSGLLDSRADLIFRNLLSTIVENAQLAALEIADGVDPAAMPDRLETVRASVARTSEILGYLVWHASRGEKEP